VNIALFFHSDFPELLREKLEKSGEDWEAFDISMPENLARFCRATNAFGPDSLSLPLLIVDNIAIIGRENQLRWAEAFL